MARAFTLFVVTLLAATIFCQTVAAQSPATTQKQRPSPWIFTVNAVGVHQSEADLDDSDRSFNVDRWFVNGGLTFAWSARKTLSLTVGGGKSIYDFDSSTGAVGELWGNTSDTRVSLAGRIGFGETGVLLIMPTLRDDSEDGADSSDGQTYGLFAAATWRYSKNLTIGPGIGIFSQLEDGVKIFPVLAIDWDISDHWNLSTGSGVGSSQGAGLTLKYKLSDDWSFGLSGRYEDREFRLNNKGVAPGGVGRDESFPLVASAELTPNRKLKFSLFAGVSMFGNLEVEDLSGGKIETDYDPALLVGAAAEIRF